MESSFTGAKRVPYNILTAWVTHNESKDFSKLTKNTLIELHKNCLNLCVTMTVILEERENCFEKMTEMIKIASNFMKAKG